jgi:hypothetical protein
MDFKWSQALSPAAAQLAAFLDRDELGDPDMRRDVFPFLYVALKDRCCVKKVLQFIDQFLRSERMRNPCMVGRGV